MKISRLLQGSRGLSSAANAAASGDSASAGTRRSGPAGDASQPGLTARPGTAIGGTSAAPRNKGILARLSHPFGRGSSSHQNPKPVESRPAPAGPAVLSRQAREDIESRIELKEELNAARKHEQFWNSELKKEPPETAHLSAAASLATQAKAARAAAEKAYWLVEHKTATLDPGTAETTLADLRQRLEQARSLEAYWVHGAGDTPSPDADLPTLSRMVRRDIEDRIGMKNMLDAARRREAACLAELRQAPPETSHWSAALQASLQATTARQAAERMFLQAEHKKDRLDPGEHETTLDELHIRLDAARSTEAFWEADASDPAQPDRPASPASGHGPTGPHGGSSSSSEILMLEGAQPPPHITSPERPASPDAGQGFEPQVPGPSVRQGDGFFSKLGRGLRPTPGTVQFTPFVGIRVVSPTPARAQFDTEGRLRTPQEGASKPAALPGKIESTAKAFAGPTRGVAMTADQVRQDLAAAEADVRILLQGGESAVAPTRLPDPFRREDLVDRVMTLAGAASPARTLASALADVAGTDVARANAALDALLMQHAPREAKLDAFCIERTLAKTDLGHETLRALLPALEDALEDADLSALDRAVQRAASMHTLRLADQLIEGLPDGVRKPAGLQQAVQMANAALPPEQRSTLVAGTHAAGAALKSARELTAARALVCALELQVDPAAMPHLALRSAYLAYRNGFDSEGPGTELARFQGRLAKLITYAERAAGPSASFPQRVLGHGKSPLSALPFGSAGARLRNPADDFAHVAGAVGMLATQLNRQIEDLPDRRSPEAVGKAIRIAAACRYQQEIAEHGWRDKVSIGRSMRHKIVADVVQSLGVDKDVVRRSDAYKELKAMNAMEAGTLRQWAGREGLETTPQLDQQLKKLEGLHNNGDWFPAKGEVTPENVMGVLRDVLLNARSTFDVRYTDSGIHGINANISQIIADAASLLAIPTAVVGPDVKAVRGRQAMVGVGSSSHGGTLFVGTDTRATAHAGVTGVAGWSFLKDHLSVTAGMQFLPLVKDWSAPKGAMIRTRMDCIGTTAHGMEPWRAKMLEVFDTITKSGPDGALPSSKTQVWDALAEHFFKDPDVSFNWMQTEASSTSSTLTGTVGARGSYAGGYKTGLMGSLGGSRFWGNAMHRQDAKGAMKVETISHSSGGGFAVSGALVQSPIPLGDFSETPGHVKQVQLPSAPVIGGSASFLTSSVGTVLRIANDGDRIIPGVTYRDLEFGNVATYLQYVDSRNNAWATSATQFDAAGEVVAQGQDVVNKFLTQVKGNADRGNQIFCERQVMTPEAARAIDELREAFVRMTPKVESEQARKARTEKMDAGIEAITKDDSSWRNRFLFVMEANTRQRVVGPAYLVQAQTQTDVSHLHMTAALRAND
jgi:hypothetical protein